MELKGLYTALVTPFRGGAVDYGKLRELVEMQIEGASTELFPSALPANRPP